MTANQAGIQLSSLKRTFGIIACRNAEISLIGRLLFSRMAGQSANGTASWLNYRIQGYSVPYHWILLFVTFNKRLWRWPRMALSLWLLLRHFSQTQRETVHAIRSWWAPYMFYFYATINFVPFREHCLPCATLWESFFFLPYPKAKSLWTPTRLYTFALSLILLHVLKTAVNRRNVF